MLRRIVLIACVISLAAAGAANAQLVNGNFNQSSPSGAASTTLAPGNATGLADWTVDPSAEFASGSSGIEFGTSFGTPGLSSTQSVFLATGSATFKEGGIQQTVATIPGQVYKFTIEAKDKNGVSSTAGTISFSGQAIKVGGLSKNSWTSDSGTAMATSSSTLLDITGNPATADAVTVSDLTMALAQVPTIWQGNQSSDWATPGNWNTGYLPSDQGIAVTFGTANANPTPTLASSSQTAGIVNFVNGISTTLSASPGYYLYLDDTNGSSASAAVNVSGNHTISAPLQLNSSVAFTVTAGSDQLTVSGSMANGANGAQGLTLSGSGTLNLAAANTMNGSVSVNSGTLLLSNSAALQNATLGGGGVSFAGGVTTAVLGGLSGSGGFTLATTASQPVALSVGNNGQSTVFSGALSGAGSLTKIGGGALTLSGTNTFTGNTLVSGGSLVLASATALQDSNLDPSGAGTFSFGGLTAGILGGITNTGTLVMANTVAQPITLSVGNNNQNTTFAGSLQDSGLGGNLTKVGTGTLCLTGNNTYSGTTAIEGGTVQFRGGSSLPSQSLITFANTASMQIRNDGSGGTATIGNNITLSTTTASRYDTPTATIDVGSLSGSASNVTVSFGVLSDGTTANNLNGTFIFTGSNGYKQSFAAVALSGWSGWTTTLVPESSSVTILGGVMSQMTTASGGNYNTLVLDGTNTGNGNGLGSVIYGPIADAAIFTGIGYGDTRLIKSNSSLWTLAGANTYSGSTTISGGTLQLGTGKNGQDGTLYNGSTISPVTDNAALVYNYFSSETANYSIGGSGSVAMIGPGGIMLAATNGYTGPTNIASGTLALGANGSISRSSTISLGGGATFDVSQVYGFQLASGQTLSGTGNYNVNGSLTAASGSMILPGGVASAGTLNAGGLILSAGSTLSYDLGHGQDLINLNGGLTVNGGGVALYQSSGTSAFTTPGTYLLANCNSINGSPNNVLVLNPSTTNTYTFSASGGSLEVVIQVPYTWNGGGGSPYNWSNANNWSNHLAPASGQSIAFSGNVGLSNTNDLNLGGGSLTGIVFAPSAGAFTLSGNDVPLGGALVNYSGANQTVNLPITLTGGNQNFNTASGTLTVNGAIDDGGNGYGINVSGSGAMVLGGANTFSGTTTVTGSLRLANSAALQNSMLNLATGGSLSFAAGTTVATVAGLTGSGNISLSTATGQAVALSDNSGLNTTYGGVMSGAGGLVVQGGGELTLASNQAYLGATRIAGGALQVLQPVVTVLGSIGIQIQGTGTAITGSDGPTGAVMSNWNVLSNSPPSGTGLKDSSGAVTACAITLTGTNGGGSGAEKTSSTDPLLSGYYYEGNTSGLLTATITGIPYPTYSLYVFSQDETANHDNNLTMGGQTFYFASEGISTFAQITNKSSSVYPTGNYAVVTGLSGSSQTVSIYSPQDTGFSGFEIVSSTTGGGSSLPSSTPLIIGGGGTFDMTNCQQTVFSLSSTDGRGSSVLLGNGILTVAGNAVTTFDGTISDEGGGGSLIVQGGRLTLTGQNTYSGATTILGGTLQLASGGPTGDGTINSTSVVSIIGGNAALLYSYTDNQTVAYLIGGNGSLVKAGTAALTLTGASGYTGTTTISGGTLQLGNGQAGYDGSISGASPVLDNAALVYDLAGSQTVANGISGSGSLTVVGGSLTLTGSSTYTGPTTIGGGTLQLGNGQGGHDGSISGTSLVSDNAALIYDLAGVQTAPYDISGSGSLTLAGGTLTLSGTNSSYGGGTLVEAGMLVVANDEAIADGTSLTVGNPLLFAPLSPAGSVAGDSGAGLQAGLQSAAVPEPGTPVLLLAASALLLLRRRRRSPIRRIFRAPTPFFETAGSRGRSCELGPWQPVSFASTVVSPARASTSCGGSMVVESSAALQGTSVIVRPLGSKGGLYVENDL